VTEIRALRRVELALAGLGLTVGLLAFVVALDALHYHGLTLEPQIAFAALDVVVIARALASALRQLRAQRRFLRELVVLRTAVIDVHRVRVVPGRDLAAFCAGMLRPEVYLSEGTMSAAGGAELRAIVAHEAHHRARRDPLRLLLARVVSDALRPLPPFVALAEREAALADLLADAAAVDALGDRTPLASALVRFDSVAPERVDRLVRAGPALTIPSALLVAAGAALVGIAALVAPMLLADWHPDLTIPPAIELAALVLACAPACLAARRAGICVRPSA
jgi:peptidase M48-like protein